MTRAGAGNMNVDGLVDIYDARVGVASRRRPSRSPGPAALVPGERPGPQRLTAKAKRALKRKRRLKARVRVSFAPATRRRVRGEHDADVQAAEQHQLASASRVDPTERCTVIRLARPPLSRGAARASERIRRRGVLVGRGSRGIAAGIGGGGLSATRDLLERRDLSA